MDFLFPQLKVVPPLASLVKEVQRTCPSSGLRGHFLGTLFILWLGAELFSSTF